MRCSSPFAETVASAGAGGAVSVSIGLHETYLFLFIAINLELECVLLGLVIFVVAIGPGRVARVGSRVLGMVVYCGIGCGAV